MRHAFITGTSRGLGRALAELLLHEGWWVTGIARAAGPVHERYTHVWLDLTDEAAVANWNFPALPDAEQVVLVNNAGSLDPIGHAGQLPAAALQRVLRLNLSAPVVLTNTFLKAYAAQTTPQLILNISSGAGKYPVDGWSLYCAAKAGLDLFTRTVHEELVLDGRTHVRIFSVAPGVVDTAMQATIRAADASAFSRVKEFNAIYTNGQLLAPSDVAQNYLRIFNSPGSFPEPVFAAKDIPAQPIDKTPIH